jgi:hypothetical protein
MTSRRPSPFAIVATAVGLFLVVFALLTFQVRAHARPVMAGAPAPVRRVLERRVMIRKVIVVVRRSDDSGAAAPARAVVRVAPPTLTPPAASAPAPRTPAPPLVSRTS